jgi:hypothetical protein
MNVRVFAPMSACQCFPLFFSSFFFPACVRDEFWVVGSRTEVEDEVAHGHENYRRRRAVPATYTVVHAPSHEEQHTKDDKAPGKPLSPRDTVGEEDEGGAAGDGGDGNSQQILLGLFDEDVVDCVARQQHVSLPQWKPLGSPAGDGRIASGESRVPAGQRRIQLRFGFDSPQVGKNTAVIK